MPTRFFLIALTCSLLGCETFPDSHPEAFTTLKQAAIERKAKLMSEWQDLAVLIVHSNRPDIAAEKIAPTSVRLSADGIARPLDLAPLADQIYSHPEQDRAIIASAVADAEKQLDHDRVVTMGFARAKEALTPLLIAESSATTRPGVVSASGLNWVPVVRLKGGAVPVSDDILSAWKISAEDVQKAAMTQLAAEWSRVNDPIETTALDPFGRTGKLRPDVNPASILLPEFLPAVRKAWQTHDDLAFVLLSPASITFAERGNEKLLAILYPSWKAELQRSPDALSTLPMELSDRGWSFLDYVPTTKPATMPTSKPTPTPYLVQ